METEKLVEVLQLINAKIKKYLRSVPKRMIDIYKEITNERK